MSIPNKTLVLGASTNPTRYSHLCILEFAKRSFPVEAVGLREGLAGNISIMTGQPWFENIHTITLYLGANNQKAYYNYILSLNPKRVIFNPGAENPEFELMLENAGIEVVHACSIMMLHAGVFYDD
ncbi:MAG: CoA-binding protein [Bacteroidetes bacterium]|nr:CoA-binding protein [Bacteroidota bacterium]